MNSTIVNYVLSSGRSKGQVRPATVVRDWGGSNPHGALNLQVHTDFTNDFESGQNGSKGTLWACLVPYSEGKEPGTWHHVESQHQAHDKRAQVEHNFTYHAPKPEQQPKYARLRELAKELGLAIVDLTPESREQSMAITDLENCIMHANAAIARHS